MEIVSKIFAGGKTHRSRFHDEKGNHIDLNGFKFLPHCLTTTFLRLSTGWRPALPWISYRAIRRLKQILSTSKTKMVEFGSGMSTVWFSKHCQEVVSIEDYEGWYQKVKGELSKRNIHNVEYKFKPSNQYPLLEEYPDNYFDFILVDGSQRANCVATALKKVKPKGYIYLDNSDKNPTEPDGDLRVAENLLLNAAQKAGGKVEYFVDFVPTYLAVTQGMLVQV